MCVDHERRFKTSWQKLHELVSKNILGAIIYAAGHLSHDKLSNLLSDNWRTKSELAPATWITVIEAQLSDLIISLLRPVEFFLQVLQKKL